MLRVATLRHKLKDVSFEQNVPPLWIIRRLYGHILSRCMKWDLQEAGSQVFVASEQVSRMHEWTDS